MKFLTDWRRPEERDDILWIDDDSKHENNNLGPSDPYSRETWPSENINDDPPDKGWGGSFDSVSHIPEIPKNTIDMRSEDPDDALWIDDDPHDETISETFSSEPSTSFTFTASSPLESMEDEVESEGYFTNTIYFYLFELNILQRDQVPVRKLAVEMRRRSQVIHGGENEATLIPICVPSGFLSQ